MQVVILCGGRGVRMEGMTENLPKPLIEIGEKEMIRWVIDHYKKFGLKDFLLLTGFGHEKFKKFAERNKDVNIEIVFTGEDSSKGDRLRIADSKKKIKFDEDGDFCLSYGDDISNVDIKDVIKEHKASRDLVTLTSVRPFSDFGVIIYRANKIIGFDEKPQLDYWINGGYMVVNKKFLPYLQHNAGDETDVFKVLAKEKRIGVYKHDGFWKTMNTIKDFQNLEEMWENKILAKELG